MVGRTISQVGNKRIPSPLVSTVLVTHIKGNLGSRNVGEVVQGRTTIKALTTNAGILNTPIVARLSILGT